MIKIFSPLGWFWIGVLIANIVIAVMALYIINHKPSTTVCEQNANVTRSK